MAAEGSLQCSLRNQHNKPGSATRVKALGTLSRWIEDDSKNNRVHWVYGAAVFENQPLRKISQKTRQICTSDTLREVLGPSIIKMIRMRPNIFEIAVEQQFQRLSLDPFSKLAPVVGQHLANLIVVDGVDECVDLRSQ
ncbi:nwd2 [Moniliophthora roreri]|nr:nwd2 [Moniliophthora roreri]